MQIQPLFDAVAPSRTSAASVTFRSPPSPRLIFSALVGVGRPTGRPRPNGGRVAHV